MSFILPHGCGRYCCTNLLRRQVFCAFGGRRDHVAEPIDNGADELQVVLFPENPGKGERHHRQYWATFGSEFDSSFAAATGVQRVDLQRHRWGLYSKTANRDADRQRHLERRERGRAGPSAVIVRQRRLDQGVFQLRPNGVYRHRKRRGTVDSNSIRLFGR